MIELEYVCVNCLCPVNTVTFKLADKKYEDVKQEDYYICPSCKKIMEMLN